MNVEKIEELNEKLIIVQDELNMNEMANIEKCIIVHNDREPGQEGDNLKFAHFHFNNYHFRFRQDCPKNISQLRDMLVFKSEKLKIQDKTLNQLLKILQKLPSGKKRGNYKNVYDLVIDTWETLNEREADYIE